jgi:uracil-DNA glycosylase family 4
MSESKIKFRETLGHYVEVLHGQGVRHVSLDRQAREAILHFAAAKPMGKPSPASAPASASASASDAAPRPRAASAAASSSAPAAKPLSVPPAMRTGPKQDQLDQLAARIRAELAVHPFPIFRSNIVFGEGNPDAAILFIGEAPGAEEDKAGRPFVGRAGQLLTKMIQAMGIEREQVYIANILKCRPDMPPGVPGNRKPTPEEMAVCIPYIQEQIEIIRPRAIVALGSTAIEALLDTKMTISRLRGTFVDYRGVPLMPTFHPSYLLHNPTNATKRKVWEDLMQVMTKVGMPISEKQKGFFLS